MPIYEYRCAACGFQKEYLQKMSDAPLTDCPECGKASLAKMVTAAGFQLKGSGWYVTDFKQGAKPSTGVAGKPAGADSKDTAKAETGDAAKAETGAAKPAADTPAKKSEAPAASSASGTTTSGSN
jgi:putative FmdB family regulatory protein